jgi:hypothetical protein
MEGSRPGGLPNSRPGAQMRDPPHVLGCSIPQNTYCIVRGNKLVLIDAAFQCCQPALAGLLERGAEVAAVCFSHRHVPAVSNAASEVSCLTALRATGLDTATLHVRLMSC